MLAHEYKAAFISGLFVDAILLFLSAIITDGGAFGVILMIAVLAGLALKVIIPLRRPKKPSKTDLIWIRSASVFFIPVSIAFSLYFTK
jgi:hypothetical protein